MRESSSTTYEAPHEADSHPASLAWVLLGRGPVPIGVDTLKESKKTRAYRLHLPDGTSVIAKRHAVAVSRRETALYEKVLRPQGVPAPAHLGFVDAPEAGLAWTFLEDVGDAPVSWHVRANRDEAAEWLASLHALEIDPGDSRELGLTVETPDNYSARLREVRCRVARWPGERTTRSQRREALARLDHAVATMRALSGEWTAETSVLVHGDFAEKNLRRGPVGSGHALLVFDWDMAAISSPAVDLWWMAPFHDCSRTYALTEGANPGKREAGTALRQVTLGVVLRTIDHLDWKSWSEWQANSIFDLTERLDRTLSALVGRT